MASLDGSVGFASKKKNDYPTSSVRAIAQLSEKKCLRELGGPLFFLDLTRFIKALFVSWAVL